ncbi:lipase [Apiospora arundinis]
MDSKKSFTYAPLDLSRPALRLLCLKAAQNVLTPKCNRTLLEVERPPAIEKESLIECELIEAFYDADSVPDYEAVSYTWGTADGAREICLEGSTFWVTHNLWSLLRDIRYLVEDRILWIDAICIDQGNHGERGHQVQQMAQIYHRARSVIIWLGPLTEPISIIMDALLDLQQHVRGLTWAPNDLRWQLNRERIERFSRVYLITLGSTFAGILERPWFTRAWIIQEVANARAAVVYCGSKSVSARVFAACPNLLQVQISEHCQAVFDVMPGPSRRESWWSRDRDLYTLLKTFSGTEATRQHDRIYALLGLCPEANSKITTDYNKTIPQLIQEIVAFICECDIDDIRSINLDTVPKFLDNLKMIHNRVLECMFKYSHADVAEAYLLKNKAKLYVGPKLCEIAADYGHRSEQVLKIIFGLDRRVLKSKYAGGEKLLGIIRHGNNGIATAKVLLERHAGDIINHYNAKGIMPLTAAAKLGNWSLVKLLLAHGADYDFEDYLRRTPLSYASDAGHPSIVELLLIEGAGCQYGATLTGGDTPPYASIEKWTHYDCTTIARRWR